MRGNKTIHLHVGGVNNELISHTYRRTVHATNKPGIDFNEIKFHRVFPRRQHECFLEIRVPSLDIETAADLTVFATCVDFATIPAFKIIRVFKLRRVSQRFHQNTEATGSKLLVARPRTVRRNIPSYSSHKSDTNGGS